MLNARNTAVKQTDTTAVLQGLMAWTIETYRKQKVTESNLQSTTVYISLWDSAQTAAHNAFTQIHG